jgi:hypothetical protein
MATLLLNKAVALGSSWLVSVVLKRSASRWKLVFASSTRLIWL